MGNIFDTMVRRLSGKRRGNGRGDAVYLCGFGKHPAWGDHVPQGGEEALFGFGGQLSEVMSALYFRGIEQTCLAIWRTQDSSLLMPMGHHVFWKRGDDLIVGRLWQSRDRSTPPRTDYPFVVAAQVGNVTAGEALRAAIPLFAGLENLFKETTDGVMVRQSLAGARADLQRRFANASATAAANNGASSSGRGALAQLADDPALGPDGIGLIRALYRLDDCDPGGREPLHTKFLRAAREVTSQEMSGSNSETVSALAASLLATWHDALIERFGAKADMLLLLPHAHPWIDVIAGPPRDDDFKCLRIQPPLIRIETDVDWNISESFKAKALGWIQDSRSAELAPSHPPRS